MLNVFSWNAKRISWNAKRISCSPTYTPPHTPTHAPKKVRQWFGHLSKHLKSITKTCVYLRFLMCCLWKKKHNSEYMKWHFIDLYQRTKSVYILKTLACCKNGCLGSVACVCACVCDVMI